MLEIALVELVAPAGGVGAIGVGGADPDVTNATVGEAEVMAAPPIVPVMVAVPTVVGEVSVAV